MKFNATHALRDNLVQAREEKVKVEVHLRGGTTLTGYVDDVGEHSFVLTRLTGKEFFDALVRVDDVCAVEAQVRTR